MDQAKVNGGELEYEATGSGEPVILIGTGPIADSFLPFVSEKALVERYHLIRYHQRGQVGSTPRLEPVSFAEHAVDAAALLAHLGISCAHVAGHSTGAIIALQLSRHRSHARPSGAAAHGCPEHCRLLREGGSCSGGVRRG